MGSNGQKVIHYAKIGQTWDFNNPTTLTDANDVVVRKGWGSVKDTFEFMLDKGNEYFDGLQTSTTPDIQEQDLIRVWFKENPTDNYVFTDSDLIVEGVVRSIKQSLDDSGNIVTIQGVNFAEVFFDAQIPVNFVDKTFGEMVRAMVTEILPNIGVTISVVIPTRKQDGVTEFPRKNLTLNYTPIHQIISKLTSDEYTEDGEYLWLIDTAGGEQRTLLILPKSDELSSLQIDDDSVIFNEQVARNKDDVKNFIIYNCGTDLKGNDIESVHYDVQSIGRFGYKTYYMLEETGNIFGNLHVDEYTQNADDFTFDTQGNLDNPYPSSYPYTFYFNTSLTAGDDDEFNELLRVEALRQGEEKAIALATESNKPSYMYTVNNHLRNDYVLGEKYAINRTAIRPFDKLLRLKDISYTIRDTTAMFDEDERDRT